MLANLTVALVLTASAASNLWYEDEAHIVELTKLSCGLPGIQNWLRENAGPDVYHANVWHGKQHYNACYTKLGEHYILVDQDGTAAAIAEKLFKKRYL